MQSTDGVSEVIGSIMLISLVVLAVAIVGVGILSQPPPVQTQYLDAIPGISEAKGLFMYHSGGDPLYPGDFFVRVDGVDYYQDKLSIYEESWPWEIGKLLNVDDNQISEYSRIQVISTAGGQRTIILDIGDAGISPITPTPTATPSPTPTPTPTPALPVANFVGSPTSGTRPLSVVFTDTSTGVPTSWFWNFGDGNNSTAQNPTHTYVTAGTYTVNLTATNANGSDTVTKTGYITVTNPPPVADFIGTPITTFRLLSVAFTDLSTESPTSWSWSFGDGGSSTVQNPTHQYMTAGTYTVSLTATNAVGSDTETKTNYITINEPTFHNIILNSNRPGTVLQPGYMQFRTTKGGNYVDIDNVQYSIGNNAIVRLTINSDDSTASIYGNGGGLTTFTFSDVTLSVDGVTQATGAVTGINIKGSTDRSSTLVFISPAVSPTVWTQFQVDGTNLIFGQDGRKITLFGITHNTNNVINFNRPANYYVFRSAYVTDPPL